MATEAEKEVVEKLERVPEGESATLNPKEIGVLKGMARFGLFVKEAYYFGSKFKWATAWAFGIYMTYVTFADMIRTKLGLK